MANPSKKSNKKVQGFSDFEKAAMRERAEELRMDKKDGEAMLLSKIAAMPEPDRTMAKRVHELVTKNAPQLKPKTWYGMPAYAGGDGKVVCFFQSGAKYKVRYCTLGFTDSAIIDDGDMFPTGFAVKRLSSDVEKKIIALVKKSIKS